jgi:benzoylformate decarboxylase
MTGVSAERRGVDFLLDSLEASGIGYVFGNPGTFEQSFMEALSRRPKLSYFLGLHETVAVAMADGYARASGEPAFVSLHISAGLANGLSQIYNAMIHHSPLVITAGQAQTHMLIAQPLLAADTVSLAVQFTKWAWELRDAGDLPTALRRAFKVALSTPPGPVFLSLPIDVLDQAVRFPLEPYSDLRRGTAMHSEPDSASIAVAAEAICAAQNPVILCGDDVGRSAATQNLIRLAEAIGAEVFAVSQCEVSFPNDHPQFVRTLNPGAAATRGYLAHADVVIAVGTPLFQQLLDPGTAILPDHARIIHLVEAAWEGGKNVPVDAALLGELPRSIDCLESAVTDAMSGRDVRSVQDRRSAMTAKKSSQRARLEQRLMNATGDTYITELALMAALRRALPDDYRIIEEAPSAAGALHQIFAFSRPGSLFGNRGGALGWGMPAALGVQLACPNSAVVAVVGDGAANFSIQTFWTAARYRLPVKFVICNNLSYRILKTNLAVFSPEVDLTGLVGMDLVDPEIDFVSLARGYGISARRVERPGELDEVLTSTMREDGPALIDVRLARVAAH